MAKDNYELNAVENGKRIIKENPDIPISSKSLYGIRHLQIFFHFLLTFIAYGIRVNLSVGIVAMTTTSSSNKNIPVYPDWHDKSIVLSSFFWGYIIPQIPAGQLAKRYGPKWILVITMIICSIFSLFLPIMASSMGSKGVMLSRAVQGFCQGFIFPSLHNLLSHWVPLSERSRLGTFVYVGGSLGTVVSLIITGIISSSWYGWPMVFYIYGGFGLIWAILFGFVGANKPSQCRLISKEEKYFIECSTGSGHTSSTPWIQILTSMPVWAILISHCGQNWGYWTLVTEIPTYMSNIMNFSIKSNSYLTALPYFTAWILSFFFSASADLMINKKITSVGSTRKIFNSIGLIIPAIALVLLSFMTEDHKNIAVALLVIAVGTNSAIYSGFNINHMDISPNHSGTLMGITNCVSNIFSLVAPLVVQVVVEDDEKNANKWQIIFCLASAIYVLADIFFVVFGSGKVQQWNNNDEIRKDKE